MLLGGLLVASFTLHPIPRVVLRLAGWLAGWLSGLSRLSGLSGLSRQTFLLKRYIHIRMSNTIHSTAAVEHIIHTTTTYGYSPRGIGHQQLWVVGAAVFCT
jgi:hypothetical protein